MIVYRGGLSDCKQCQFAEIADECRCVYYVVVLHRRTDSSGDKGGVEWSGVIMVESNVIPPWTLNHDSIDQHTSIVALTIYML